MDILKFLLFRLSLDLKRVLIDRKATTGQLLTVLGIALVILATVGLFLAPYFPRPTASVGSATVLVVGAAILAVLWVERASDYKYKSEFLVINRRFAVSYKTKDEAIYRKVYDLKALRDNVDHFSDFVWRTGKERIPKPNILDRYAKIGPRRGLNGWDIYDVYFDRPLVAGERKRIGIEFSYSSPSGTLQPFLSAFINRPTLKLELSVSMPLDIRPKNIRILEHDSTLVASIPVKIGLGEFDDRNREIRYTKDHPEHLHSYSISWEW